MCHGLVQDVKLEKGEQQGKNKKNEKPFPKDHKKYTWILYDGMIYDLYDT